MKPKTAVGTCQGRGEEPVPKMQLVKLGVKKKKNVKHVRSLLMAVTQIIRVAGSCERSHWNVSMWAAQLALQCFLQDESTSAEEHSAA